MRGGDYALGFSDAVQGQSMASNTDAYERGFNAGIRFRQAVSGTRDQPPAAAFPSWGVDLHAMPIAFRRLVAKGGLRLRLAKRPV